MSACGRAARRAGRGRGRTVAAAVGRHARTDRTAGAHLDEPPIRIATGPDHYLTGESSAVIEGVSGRPARPLFHRVHAALRQPSVLVHNVETREAARLAGFVAEVRGRGGCHHRDGAARMVASELKTFDSDVTSHLNGRCLHGPIPRSRRG